MTSPRHWLRTLRVLVRALLAGEGSGRDDTPEHLRWWEAVGRGATEAEAVRPCGQCGDPLGQASVKECPNCGLVLHASCYDATEGGRGHRTDGCDACALRTHWR